MPCLHQRKPQVDQSITVHRARQLTHISQNLKSYGETTHQCITLLLKRGQNNWSKGHLTHRSGFTGPSGGCFLKNECNESHCLHTWSWSDLPAGHTTCKPKVQQSHVTSQHGHRLNSVSCGNYTVWSTSLLIHKNCTPRVGQTYWHTIP